MESYDVKSTEMMIRDLGNRIYQLLRRSTSEQGKSVAHILADAEGYHHQYLFDTIYKHLHNCYFQHKNGYLFEEKGLYYLTNQQDLNHIFKALGISLTPDELPHYFRNKISARMLRNLVKDIPKSRILYEHRHHPTPYRFNIIETKEIEGTHPDGTHLPYYVKQLFIHKIFKLHGSFVKIWEIVPQHQTNKAPVCLIPGFGSNYYSFHFEGLHSIDYHLVKSGNHVFILDHERKDVDANVDVFIEYLATTMIDFVRERTQHPFVVLGGHSMGGLIAICKIILDAVRRPRFVTSVKALIAINAPIHFDSDYQIPEWLVQGLDLLFQTIGHQGTVPFVEFINIIRRLPFADELLCMDRNKALKTLQKNTFLEYNPHLQRLIDFQLNPFTKDIKALKTLATHAITNPPRMVVQHMGNHVKRHNEGITSFHYEELYTEAYHYVDTDEEVSEKKELGINYTKNLYRVSPAMPVLVIQTKDDRLSPPHSFFKFWGRWSHLNKLRIDSLTEDPIHHQQNIECIQKFMKQHGLSSCIGVTVDTGRHMGALQTEKALVSTFLDEVECLPYSASVVSQAVIQASQQFIQKESHEAHRFITEQDLAKKIKTLPELLSPSEYPAILTAYLGILKTFKPTVRVGEHYENFLKRSTKTIEDDEEIQYNVPVNTIESILLLQPQPTPLMKEISTYLKNSKRLPNKENIIALVDLSVALFHEQQSSPKKSHSFNKYFQDFTQECLEHKNPEVSIYALRALLRTHHSPLILQAGKLASQVPQLLKKKASQAYWKEFQNAIRRLEDSSIPEMEKGMDAWVKAAQHNDWTQL